MTASIASAGRLAVLWSALIAELAVAAQTNVQNPSDLQLNPTPSVGKGIPKT